MCLKRYKNLSKRTILLAACMLTVISALVSLFFNSAYSLLPASENRYPLFVNAVTDIVEGGDSSIALHENNEHIVFDFTLSETYPLPYANLNLMFGELSSGTELIDLSHYSEAVIKIRCSPRNELAFMLHIYEDKITELHEINSYRKAASFFTCDEIRQEIHIDLNRLVTPEWWLQRKGLNLSNQQYSLEKVKGISFTNTAQSPLDSKISVYIEGIDLKRSRKTWAIVLLAFAVCIILGVTISPAIINNLNKNTQKYEHEVHAGDDMLHTETSSKAEDILHKPALSAPQLDIKSKRERESEALITYLSSHYSEAELNLEQTAEALGLNRTKINQILRDATGHTFTTHLNKLRLTEAARLLKEKQITVSEAAFAVGFGSISYFNRVFKKEFGCPPSVYREDNRPNP